MNRILCFICDDLAEKYDLFVDAETGDPETILKQVQHKVRDDKIGKCHPEFISGFVVGVVHVCRSNKIERFKYSFCHK